jgi:hypothetical protein
MEPTAADQGVISAADGPMNLTALLLARFFDREVGFRLFEVVLCGPLLPDSMPNQTMLPGFEPPPQKRVEWRPLPHEECRHAEPGTAPDHGNG